MGIGFIVLFSLLILYIDQYNRLTDLRLKLPQLEKNLKSIQEENKRLKFEIDQFESPIYLMELMKKPEFSHLKFPKKTEIEER